MTQNSTKIRYKIIVKRPSWKYKTYSRPVDFGIHWIGAHLAERALNENETIEMYYNAGSLRNGVTVNDVIDEMKKLGGHLFRHVIPSRHDNEQWTYVWDRAGVHFEYYPKNKGITFLVRSNDAELTKSFRAVADKLITRQKTKGRVYVVTMSQDGPRLTEMGVAGEDFIPGNYSPAVVDDYRHVIKDLNSMDPCGFVTLLNGPPGSGKTHMVRAMMNEVPKATFILVPSNLTAALGSPDFMGMLLREQRKDAPMILIIEDADEAIVDRKEGNKSAISALLNFSDGIFGSLLNIRIVCTTNVKIGALDKAVMRKGRLCRDVEVGHLDGKQANEIYKRLTGKDGDYKEHKFYVLGDVYDDAKNTGRVERDRKETVAKVGFALPTREEAIEAMGPPVGTKHIDVYMPGPDGKMEKIGTINPDSELNPDHIAYEAEKDLNNLHLPSAHDLYNPTDDDSDLIDEDPDPDDDEPDYFPAEKDDDDETLDENSWHDTNPGDDWTDAED